MEEVITLADFIEYSDEIFLDVKHFKGECVDGKEQYYLSTSHALYDYVKKSKNGEKPNFTSANMDMFLNKVKYFLYPQKRSEQYKKDISVKDFSSYCVNMFYRRFGIDFDFLRITPDETNVAFVEKQKECLVDLFRDCLYFISEKMKIEKVEKGTWNRLLMIEYQNIRYQLFQEDREYLFSKYNVFLRPELEDYVSSFSRAFHHLKRVYRDGVVVIGKSEFLYDLHKDAQMQYVKAKCTIDLIFCIISATEKSDILNQIQKLNFYVFKYEDENNQIDEVRISLRKFKEFYETLDDINSEQKSTLIENLLYYVWGAVGTFPEQCAITYSMYKENYKYYYEEYKEIYEKIFEIKKKHREIYYNVHAVNFYEFQSMVQKTMLFLFREYCCQTDGDAE